MNAEEALPADHGPVADVRIEWIQDAIDACGNGVADRATIDLSVRTPVRGQRVAFRFSAEWDCDDVVHIASASPSPQS